MSVRAIPGIYSSYEVLTNTVGRAELPVIGLAAEISGAGTSLKSVNTVSEAAELFGAQSSMTRLVRIILENGAGRVICAPVQSDNYAAAFALLMAQRDIRFMLCDSRTASVHTAMQSAIEAAGEAFKYRIGFVERSGTAAALAASAQSMNSEHMVLVGNIETDGVEGSAAAAVCAAAASTNDPTLTLNGVELKGLQNVSLSFSNAELETLINGGVLPLESVGGVISPVRGITTKTLSAGVSDTSLRELNTVLIINDVMPSVRDALKAKFVRCRNNAQTRGAIRTQTLVVLEEKKKKGIIESYTAVTATADPTDATLCRVSFGFEIMHGLNSIELSVCISV